MILKNNNETLVNMVPKNQIFTLFFKKTLNTLKPYNSLYLKDFSRFLSGQKNYSYIPYNWQ